MSPSLLSLALAASLILVSCSESSFKGKNKSGNNTGRNGDATTNGTGPAPYGFNPDGSPKIGPNSLTEEITLSSGIDLIIALDTSGSMDQEKAAIASNLAQMLVTLQKSNLDPKIHLIAGTRAGGRNGNRVDPNQAAFVFPADLDPTKVAQVNQPVGSHDALSHISALLAGQYANNYRDIKGAPMAAFPLRPGAKTEILVISDDNGTEDGNFESPYSNLAAEFDKDNKWKATVSGIIGLANSAQADAVCEIAAVGQEYITLATKTGGSMLDICAKDWQVLTQRFSQDLVKRSVSVLLSQVPSDPAKIIVNLDGKELAAGTFTYNAAENRIYLAEATPYTAGMVLAVNYEPKS